MITEEFRQLVLEKLFNGNRINRKCTNKDWFNNRGLLKLYNEIFEYTKFLDSYNPSLRERIFYIENLYNNVQVCKYCNTNKLEYNICKAGFRSYCSNKECRGKHHGAMSKIALNSMTDEQRQIKAKKCSVGNSGTFESRFGKEKSDILKAKGRRRMLGTIQSQETINKRILSLQGHITSEETKRKISETNRKTHTSREFRDKYKETYDNSRIKQSISMKRRIADGDFTPPVHNSWTHWDIKINDGDNVKKFRSGWEGSFWVLNKHTQYETLRIPYEYNNVIKNYIVDFIDQENKVVYEIKPDSLKTNDINKAKEEALTKWCVENNYTYKPINNSWFHENAKNIDYIQYPCLQKSMKQFLKI